MVTAIYFQVWISRYGESPAEHSKAASMKPEKGHCRADYWWQILITSWMTAAIQSLPMILKQEMLHNCINFIVRKNSISNCSSTLTTDCVDGTQQYISKANPCATVLIQEY
jgi:hypothetical protein